jgi:CRISPR-associated protein Csx3
MSARIVVCGPPHSGKSVFVQQLRRQLLPLGIVGVVEGCPDGEGGWAGATDQEMVGTIRRKGTFTPGFVSWVIGSIERSPMPLVLVDVGGIRSSENERIFRACNGFILLANPAEVGELEAWEVFGRANGCKPVALIESVLNGTTTLAPDQGDGVVRGVQAGLERGHVLNGPVIDALIKQLLKFAGTQAAAGEFDATVHTGRLADAIGIPAEERGARMGFRPWHAGMIQNLTQEAMDRPLRLWGVGPAWVPTLVSAPARRSVALWDIRLGWVTLPELETSPDGSSHLTWVVEDQDACVHVFFAIPGGVFDPGQLAAVHVPEVARGKPIIISGRGPHWLVAAIARTYALAGHVVAVAALHETSGELLDGRLWKEVYPGLAPGVVVASSEVATPVGTVLPFRPR